MNELIQKLVEAYGPSGFEDGMREVIQAEIEAYADEIWVDALGNLIARKKGDGDGLKVMVAAHMDEIGVMITHITEKGFLRFTNIGGVFPHNLMGARVQFADGTVGVVYSEKLDGRDKVHGLDKHYIDVGATSRDDCPIEVGAAAGFKRSFLAQGSQLVAKSMDDRIGCVVGIEALKRLKKTPHDVYFVFSVQEEVGTRGAQTAANALNADVGIALDVTGTGDTPEGRTMAVGLGDGPAIKVKDAGMISHAGLVRVMRARAEEAGIPYQLEVLEGGSTDARAMQIASAGCAAGCISIPCRYVHSQSEIVDAADVENSVKLLVEILGRPIEL
ncbi:MAG: M42 family metallopeptidase [Chloroflexi bacterium]|nr:M42 family metallopeptidase [Chloroflexota bacterium]MCI0579514.1 M42 family metallopeptidase [Chloroflexota bacterium]MCI0647274.1 M42 family metallopeptidase [Chloroflexota bacterium]MCI0729313.1 M42 family metallopeptidase [Chloroflexota bacterium]